MERHQELAWDCLTDAEKNSLMFIQGKGLSTWEAGEILKMPHYKYLELKARAEEFFKLFSDYFELHPSLVNPKSPIEPRFRDYLFGAMIKRLSKEEAKIHSGDSSWLLTSITNSRIITNMKRLKESGNKWDKDLYALILEFDRWNNYRILPRILQAPSAYKRRSTKKDKVYLSYLHRIPDFKIRQLITEYWKNGPSGRRYFTAIVSDELFPEEGYGVMPIKRSDYVIKAITDLRIYIFESQTIADTFGFLVTRYFEKTVDSKGGLKFWKEYREIIQKSINYRSINNMDFTCETLDTAYKLHRKRNLVSNS